MWKTKNKFLKVSAGIGLLEMIVVLTIMSVISAALIANYRQGGRENNLQTAAQEVLSVLRKSQSDALSGLQYESELPDNYRVSFSTLTNQVYQVCVEIEYCTDKVVETVKLPEDVFIEQIILEKDAPLTTERVDVIFSIPYGDISFKGEGFNNEAANPLAIVLKNYNNSLATIKVNPLSGQFMVE